MHTACSTPSRMLCAAGITLVFIAVLGCSSGWWSDALLESTRVAGASHGDGVSDGTPLGGDSAGAAPGLRPEPQWLGFQPGESTRYLTLRNTTNEPVTFTIESEHAWLTVNPATGTVQPGAQLVSVEVDWMALPLDLIGTSLTILPSVGSETQVTVVAGRRSTTPTILPWIEINVGNEQELTTALAGLRVWRHITNTAIVTTAPNHADLYAEFNQLPEITIVPGLATNTRLGQYDFDSIDGWAAIAQDVSELVAATGQNRFVFLHESAIWPYINGEYEIDLTQLRDGLSLLPADVEYWWYPAIYWGTPEKLHRSLDICTIAEQTLDCRFIEHTFGAPSYYDSPAAIAARADLEALAAQPTLPIVWWGSSGGGQYWDYDHLDIIMDALAGRPDVTFYPGNRFWIKGAQRIVNGLIQNSDDPPGQP